MRKSKTNKFASIPVARQKELVKQVMAAHQGASQKELEGYLEALATEELEQNKTNKIIKNTLNPETTRIINSETGRGSTAKEHEEGEALVAQETSTWLANGATGTPPKKPAFKSKNRPLKEARAQNFDMNEIVRRQQFREHTASTFKNFKVKPTSFDTNTEEQNKMNEVMANFAMNTDESPKGWNQPYSNFVLPNKNVVTLPAWFVRGTLAKTVGYEGKTNPANMQQAWKLIKQKKALENTIEASKSKNQEVSPEIQAEYDRLNKIVQLHHFTLNGKNKMGVKFGGKSNKDVLRHASRLMAQDPKKAEEISKVVLDFQKETAGKIMKAEQGTKEAEAIQKEAYDKFFEENEKIYAPEYDERNKVREENPTPMEIAKKAITRGITKEDNIWRASSARLVSNETPASPNNRIRFPKSFENAYSFFKMDVDNAPDALVNEWYEQIRNAKGEWAEEKLDVKNKKNLSEIFPQFSGAKQRVGTSLMANVAEPVGGGFNATENLSDVKKANDNIELAKSQGRPYSEIMKATRDAIKAYQQHYFKFSNDTNRNTSEMKSGTMDATVEFEQVKGPALFTYKDKKSFDFNPPSNKSETQTIPNFFANKINEGRYEAQRKGLKFFNPDIEVPELSEEALKWKDKIYKTRDKIFSKKSNDYVVGDNYINAVKSSIESMQKDIASGKVKEEDIPSVIENISKLKEGLKTTKKGDVIKNTSRSERDFPSLPIVGFNEKSSAGVNDYLPSKYIAEHTGQKVSSYQTEQGAWHNYPNFLNIKTKETKKFEKFMKTVPQNIIEELDNHAVALQKAKLPIGKNHITETTSIQTTTSKTAKHKAMASLVAKDIVHNKPLNESIIMSTPDPDKPTSTGRSKSWEQKVLEANYVDKEHKFNVGIDKTTGEVTGITGLSKKAIKTAIMEKSNHIGWPKPKKVKGGAMEYFKLGNTGGLKDQGYAAADTPLSGHGSEAPWFTLTPHKENKRGK